MADIRPLFDTPENKANLLRAANVLTAISEAKPERSLMAKVSGVLTYIANDAAEFDRSCQFNIRWVGDNFVSSLKSLHPGQPPSNFEVISALLYRILVEFDLSRRNDLPMELRQFLSQIDSEYHSLSAQIRESIDYARQRMPIAIIKEVVNSSEINLLKDAGETAAAAQMQINQWTSLLQTSTEKVENLRDVLSQQKEAFNFVGLHKGFAGLASEVASELASARLRLAVFGVLLLVPSAIDLWLFGTNVIDISKATFYGTGAAMLVASITITLLLLYFFRISLRAADSCKAQLVQLRLRMALCAFIQSYAEYSNEIKQKNQDALAKFETLIFSGIVANEDKLPSTFDGLEHLAGLLKAAKGT